VSWLVGGVLPGIERQPRKKLEPNAERLLGLLHRWRDEAVKAGRNITRIALAFEAGRDGFWLARTARAAPTGTAAALAVARPCPRHDAPEMGPHRQCHDEPRHDDPGPTRTPRFM
jgi:hypothetical protein